MNNGLRNLSYSGLLLIAAFSCSSPAERPVTEKFAVTDSLLQRLLIDTVQQANQQMDLTFSARIIVDEDRKGLVYPMVSGQVRQVSVKLGDRVTKGQQLAVISSSEMAGFDKEVISSSAELRNAQRNLQQAEQLFSSGLSSARELEEAKNDFLVKQAEDKRTRAILKLNGGNNSGNYTILAPLSGYIIEKNINSNMQLRADNDQNLFTIADLSRVSAMVNIYESDIPNVNQGDRVKVVILSYPDRVFKGTVERIYNVLDSESKVMNARVNIDNPDLLLKPGMLAAVTISSTSGDNLPTVNARGVIFDNDKNYVLIVNADNKVVVREIEISRKTVDKVYISKGLTAGDRIIASKQVFLYESLMN
jgi:cobalt-zinc-cadmium efflux system membrane fusion protein